VGEILKQTPLAIAVLTAATPFLCPIPAFGQDVVSPTYEVARRGDGQLSCGALISEMNIGSQQISAGGARMQDRADRMLASTTREAPKVSAAQAVAGVVAGLVPGAGLALGVAQTLGAVGGSAPQQPAGPTLDDARGMNDAAAAMSALVPVGQRFEHLSAIFRSKGC
jgi:hypothetical protein